MLLQESFPREPRGGSPCAVPGPAGSAPTETSAALLAALGVRDPHAGEHAGRIRDVAGALGVAMGLAAEERHALGLGAILHDVGKIGIPDPILLKPGPLDEHERLAMRSHPLIGERMLQGLDSLAVALPIVKHHHERWDGLGYPEGLAGERIPLGARIVAVCDAFDAMTSDRPYRGALPLEVACGELQEGAGAQFDPGCASFLVEVVTSAEARLDDRLLREPS
ncbi:MAG: HD-GYP domain-containing protein [Actinomycetota bacterium]